MPHPDRDIRPRGAAARSEVEARSNDHPMLRAAPLAAARALLLGRVAPLPATSVPLAAAHGRILASDVRAPRAVPAFDNSAMDGYAVRLAMMEPAGVGWRVPVSEVTPICTGQPVPRGVDAVVPLERVRVTGSWLEIDGATQPGDHIRPAGEEFRAGEVALSRGSLLSPAALGLLSLLGCTMVDVVPAPRVAILVTGDEVVAAGSPLHQGQVYDANGPLLGGLVAEAGGRLVAREHAPDDAALIGAATSRLAADSDLVCTSGGASISSRDHMFATLAARGDVLVRELMIKPGRPTTLAVVSGTPVVSLPGNPFALLVGFEAIARPALLRLAGRQAVTREQRTIPAATDIVRAGGRFEFLPVRIELGSAGPLAWPLEHRGSAMLGGIAGSGYVALIPPEVGTVRAGEPLTVERWSAD